MILSVEQLKEFITTNVSDMVLQARLEALETCIRNKTHNNFQDRRFRCTGSVIGDILTVEDASWFDVDNTIMIGDDLCVIVGVENDFIRIDKMLPDNANVLVTKVIYPKDIVMGVVDVMSWILANPSAKAGISSETLSRHSVTYQGNTEFDADIGCPVRLLSFLNQYKKARF